MNRIIAIAPTKVHLKNYCKQQKLPEARLIFADRVEILRGQHRGFAFVFIQRPEDILEWEKMEAELRAKDATRLSLNINDWPLDMFA